MKFEILQKYLVVALVCIPVFFLFFLFQIFPRKYFNLYDNLLISFYHKLDNMYFALYIFLSLGYELNWRKFMIADVKSEYIYGITKPMLLSHGPNTATFI